MPRMFLLIFWLIALDANAQTMKPNLADSNKWQPINREATYKSDGVLELNAKTGDGMFVLKDTRFSEGVISVRLQGEDKPGQSFIGIAFHIQNEKTFEAIYFRPFNFRNKERETHAVQYIAMPDYPWERLRTEFPGKYENKLDPAPEAGEWLDARIVIKGKSIKVYVNNASVPSLEVESLGHFEDGKLAIWVGNNSRGRFKDLQITADKGSSARLSPADDGSIKKDLTKPKLAGIIATSNPNDHQGFH